MKIYMRNTSNTVIKISAPGKGAYMILDVQIWPVGVGRTRIFVTKVLKSSNRRSNFE
jgi:hypothetical protein